MAKTKTKQNRKRGSSRRSHSSKGRKRGRRNSARSTSTAIARRHSSRSLQPRARRNAVSRLLMPAGLNWKGIGVAIVAGGLAQFVSQLIPFGPPGSFLGVLKDGGIVLLTYNVTPKWLEPGYAAAGASAILFSNVVRGLAPGVFAGVQNTVKGWLPAGSQNGNAQAGQQQQARAGAVVY